ncbi:hypothetical protein C8P64_3030 [Christiangramia gaetbulicola]|uniref:Dolichyl-phosphate-mannose-protein mannosyltransferase n=1 Tax=Christiangramia gaetbulicola TaxID=703340 RepID=A0A2T6AFK5_9FLAO|nr:hypothetical protein [Christiangramia gaetbulicola]PTX42600.1 hypothetical protein C8P64_3030 [Christiangramia gaetbulicola]
MLNQFKIITFIFILIFLFTIYFSISNSYISSDAPYYLSVARDISKGYIPYKDIYLSYTPLMMYMNAPIYYIFEKFNYKNFLIFQYFIIFLTQLIFFKISRNKSRNSVTLSLFLTVLFGLAILSSDGNYINLEVYSLLSVMIAIYFYLNSQILFTGFFLALSFLFKQYGILNFIPFIFLIYNSENEIVKRLVLLGFGAVLPVLFFLIYFVVIKNLSLNSLLAQLSGVEYIKYSVNKFPGFFNWILGAKVFLLLVIPVLILVRKKVFERKNIPWLIGIIVSLLPTFLNSFQHYFINALPYIFMLIMINWKKDFEKALKPLIFGGLLFSLMLIIRVSKYSEVYVKQISTAEKVKQLVPEGNTIFLNGGIRYLYSLNDYNNPFRKRIGYSYIHFLSAEDFEAVKFLSDSLINTSCTERIELGERKYYLKLLTRN